MHAISSPDKNRFLEEELAGLDKQNSNRAMSNHKLFKLNKGEAGNSKRDELSMNQYI